MKKPTALLSPTTANSTEKAFSDKMVVMLRKILNTETLILTILSLAIGLVGFFSDGTIFSSIQISYRQTPETGEFVVVSFPASISKEQAIKSFSISPAVDGEQHWLEEDHELFFYPSEGFQSNTPYTVKIQPPSLFAQLLSSTNQNTFQSKNLPTKFHARLLGNSTIYYITEAGLKRPITPEIFFSYPENREEDIIILDRQTLDLYPDNVLVHLKNGSPIYKLENGTKRHVQNVETFNTLGFDWKSVALVNQFELDSYPEKEPLVIDQDKGKRVDVDLTAMKLTMWENGKTVKEIEVAGQGNPKVSPTRKGFFTILSKEKNHLSSLSRVWMPWSMRYSGNYYLHGWPYWPSGQKLNSKYSGGCVRLFDNDVQKVYEFVEVGTPIVVR